MLKCSKCGKAIKRKNTKFCPFCGSAMMPQKRKQNKYFFIPVAILMLVLLITCIPKRKTGNPVEANESISATQMESMEDNLSISSGNLAVIRPDNDTSAQSLVTEAQTDELDTMQNSQFSDSSADESIEDYSSYGFMSTEDSEMNGAIKCFHPDRIYSNVPRLRENMFWIRKEVWNWEDEIEDVDYSVTNLIDFNGDVIYSIKGDGDHFEKIMGPVDDRIIIKKGAEGVPVDLINEREVGYQIITTTDGEELRRFQADTTTGYSILGYVDGYFVVEIYKTEANVVGSLQRYLLFLDRDGKELFDPIKLEIEEDYFGVHLVYLGEGIFYANDGESFFVNAKNGIVQRYSGVTFDFAGPFYNGKTVAQVHYGEGADLEFEYNPLYIDDDADEVFLFDSSEFLSGNDKYVPQKLLIRRNSDGGKDQEHYADGGKFLNTFQDGFSRTYLYSEGLLIDNYAYVFDLEGHQYDWFRRYIKGEYYRLNVSGFSGGYALVMSVKENYEGQLTLIDRTGKEVFTPMYIDPSVETIIDYHDGYTLIMKENRDREEREYYWIFPDGSKHSWGDAAVSELEGSYSGKTNYSSVYFVKGLLVREEFPFLTKADGTSALDGLTYTENTSYFIPDSDADTTYNDTLSGRQDLVEDAPGRDPMEIFSEHLSSPILYDQDGVVISVAEIHSDSIVFDIENNTDYLHLSVTSEPHWWANNIYIEDADSYPRTWELDSGEKDIMKFPLTDALSQYWKKLDELGKPECFSLPIECMMFQLAIQVGSESEVQNKLLTLTADTYQEKDMELFRGDIVDETEILLSDTEDNRREQIDIWISNARQISEGKSGYSLICHSSQALEDPAYVFDYNNLYDYEYAHFEIQWVVNGDKVIQRDDVRSNDVVSFYYTPDEIHRELEIPGSTPLKIEVIVNGEVGLYDENLIENVFRYTLTDNYEG